jgi:hypothetical protein
MKKVVCIRNVDTRGEECELTIGKFYKVINISLIDFEKVNKDKANKLLDGQYYYEVIDDKIEFRKEKLNKINEIRG